jgi:hypothetical protein
MLVLRGTRCIFAIKGHADPTWATLYLVGAVPQLWHGLWCRAIGLNKAPDVPCHAGISPFVPN